MRKNRKVNVLWALMLALLMVFQCFGGALAEHAEDCQFDDAGVLSDYQYSDGTQLQYAGYNLETILGGGYAAVVFGDAEFAQHTMGGVLVEGDMIVPAAGFGDAHNLLPSYIAGNVTRPGGTEGGKYNGRDYHTTPLYVSTKNTIEAPYDQNYWLSGFQVTHNMKAPVYHSTAPNGFVDFDLLEAVVKAISAKLATEPAFLPTPYWSYSENAYAVDVKIGSTVDIPAEVEINGKKEKIAVVNLVGNIEDSGRTLINFESSGKMVAPVLLLNGNQMQATAEENDNGSSIVFNFPHLTELTWLRENGTSNSYPWIGHIIAPNAHVDIRSGNNAGTVVCKSFFTLSENHVYAYHGPKFAAAEYAIPVKKIVQSYDGTLLNPDKNFTFTLEAQTPGAPMPSSKKLTLNGSSVGHFGNIKFDEDDIGKTYVYHVTENAAQYDQFYSYDADRYVVEITVTQIGNQVMAMPTIKYQEAVWVVPNPSQWWNGYYEYKDATLANTIEFINSNNEQRTSISGKKVWVGDDVTYRPNRDGVKLTLYRKAGEYGQEEKLDAVPSWTVNAENNNEWIWTFDGLIKQFQNFYWWEDYIYYVKEEPLSGYSISYSKGNSASNNQTITNTFTGTTAQFSFEKTLNTANAPESNFYFTLEGATGNEPMPQAGNNAMITLPNGGQASGSVSFGKIAYPDVEKEYTYYIRETNSHVPNFEYDETYYKVVVKVEKEKHGPNAGQLKTKVDYHKVTPDGKTQHIGPKDSVVFNNAYTTPDATATITAKKTVNNSETFNELFTFELNKVENGVETFIEEVHNNGSSIAFSELTFTEVGTHEYRIREVALDDPNYSCDVEYVTVYVTVADNNGTLTATVTYGDQSNTSAVINNTKETVTITVNKKWEGDQQDTSNRPDYIWVELEQDGSLYDSKQVYAADGWTYTWPELPKYYMKDGVLTLHEYKVSEPDRVNGYLFPKIDSERVEGTDEYIYTITNTYIEKGQTLELNFSVVKKLEGGETDEVFNFILEPTDSPAPAHMPVRTDNENGKKLENGDILFEDGVVAPEGYADYDPGTYRYLTTSTTGSTDGEEAAFRTIPIDGDDIIYRINSGYSTAFVWHIKEDIPENADPNIQYDQNKYAVMIAFDIDQNGKLVIAEREKYDEDWNVIGTEKAIDIYYGTANYIYDREKLSFADIGNQFQFTFTNTVHTTSISVTKDWNGATPVENLEKYLTLKRVRSGSEAEDQVITAGKLSVEGNRYTWNDLPMFNADGSECVYYVVEAQVPGFKLPEYSNVGEYDDLTNGAYHGGTITNTKAETEASIKVLKYLTLVGVDEIPEAEAKTFTFTLVSKNETNEGFKILNDKVSVTMYGGDSMLTAEGEFALKFTKAGIYRFEVSEDKPATIPEGMFYSSYVEEYALQVVEAADGSLSVWQPEFDIEFINYYGLSRLYFEKQWNDANSGVERPDKIDLKLKYRTVKMNEENTEFIYGEWQEFDGYPNESKYLTNIEKNGNTWEIEINGLPAYMNGESVHWMAVESTVPAGYTASYVNDDSHCEGITDAVGFSGTITNTLISGAADELTITKAVELIGDTAPATDEEFTFTVERISAPDGAAAFDKKEVTLTDGGSETVPLAFDKVGDYTFTVAEVPPAESAPGYIYDETTYTVTYTVDLVGSELQVTNTVWQKNDADITVTSADFVNTYGKVSVQLTAAKQLDGADLAADQFTFVLKGEGIEDGKKNAADGSVTFDTLSYTADGEYKYTISEMIETAHGYAYDKTIHNVTVTVATVGDQMTATVDYAPADESTLGTPPVFVNKYGITQVEGTKTWDDGNNQDGKRPDSITIRLLADNVEVDYQVLTATGEGADKTWPTTFKFDNLPKYNSEGKEIEYTITEDAVKDYSSDVVGYDIVNSYKPGTAEVTVTKAWVEANGDTSQRPEYVEVQLLADGEAYGTPEKLTAPDWQYTWHDLPAMANGKTVAYTVEEVGRISGYVSSVEGDATKGYTITNTLAEGEFELEFTKTLLNGEKLAQGEERSFAFNLYEYDNDTKGELVGSTNIILSNSNAKEVLGTITFNMKNGVHYYLLEEEADKDSDIVYSKQQYKLMVYAKVDYMENGEAYGELVPEDFTYELINVGAADAIEFTNTYVADVFAQIEATKKLNGATLAAEQFSFTLSEDGEVLQTKKNAADGSIVFDAITYSAAGTYTYTIKEVIPETKAAGYIYDEAERTVTVEVTQDPDTKQLSAKVNYGAADAIEFTNTYVADVFAQIEATKKLNGATLAAEQFSFTLSEDGEVLQTKTNAADGSIVFDAITYSAAGTYTYTIKEVIPETKADGYIYDEAERTVTVEVTQDPDTKQLSAKVNYGAAGKVEFTNRYSETTAALTVTKKLVHTGDLPEARTFTFVLKDGEGNVLESQTLTFDKESEDQQSVDFAAITYKKVGQYTYTVTETASDDAKITSDPAEYQVTVDVQPDDNGELLAVTTIAKDGKAVRVIEFTNTYNATVDITGTKKWVGDSAAVRPDSITLYLAADLIVTDEVPTFTGTDTDNWSWSFTNLPKYNSEGKEISYTVSEQAVEGYVTTYNKYDITNTYNPGKTTVKVTKRWFDGDNADNLRPASIQVQLYAADVALGDPVTLSEADGWNYVWPELDEKNSKGEKIAYTVKEVGTLDGYTITVAGVENQENTFLITNTHEVATTDISVEKDWQDNNDQDGLRPDSITVNLLADGEIVEGKSVELSEANGWSYTWTGLTKNKAGVAIDYTVEEVKTAELSAYQVTVEGTAESGYTIINTYAPGKTSVEVTKKWEDGDNVDNLRPASIKVKLLANDTEKATAELTAANGWKYTFAELDEKVNGQTIKYTVKEVSVDGYESAITGDATEGYTITNTHEVATTEISVAKDWQDNNDQDGLRPDSITVNLLADGEIVEGKSVELSEANGWSYTWTGLTKNKAGVAIDYTVEEVKTAELSAYQVTVEGTAESGYTIINTYAPGKTSVEVTKKWEDGDNVDNLRPASITVKLLANGTEKATAELTEANGWKYTFAELDEKANGQTIKYTVKEVSVDGYESAITGDATKGYTITNTHEAIEISVKVSKFWADESNKLKKRPEEITINLLADGDIVRTEKVTGTGDTWTHTFTGLPKNKLVDGKSEEIKYTITEEAVKNYETVINGYDVTNTCTYKAGGSMTLVGSKKLTGDVLQVAEKTFSFGVYKGDTKVADGYNTAEGEIVFDAIKYTLDDIGASYTYTVKEVAGLAADDTYNYTYDDTIYTVSVNVKDGGNGTLIVTEDIYIGSTKQEEIVFTNAIVKKVGAISVKKVDAWDTQKGLGGAVFGVYSDENCKTWVADLRTGDTGVSASKTLPIGTYWVKETVAPSGYLLDSETIYEVEVLEGKIAMVNGTYVPNTKLARLELQKSDRLNPGKKLPGAEYTVYTDEECGEDDVFAVITTGENGIGAIDDVPPGRYWVKETKAPTGYELDPEAYPVDVPANGDPDKPVFVAVEDYPLRGALTISKTVVGVEECTESFLFDIELTIATDDPIIGSYDATLNGNETEPVTFEATENGAKTTVTLKSGETLAIHGLREGVTYTVTEQANARYDTMVNGAQAVSATGAIKTNAVSVVEYQNTLKLIGFTVEKVWVGAQGGDIQLNLYADGVKVEPQPAYTKEGNVYTYADLVMVDDNGKEIVYTVKETAMAGYATSYTNVAPYADKTDCAYNGGKIINQALTGFSVKKEWNGLADGEKAPAIQLTLYCNGTIYTKVTPAPDANGWYTYSDLPATVNGKEAVYTVKEEPVSGFTTTYINKGDHAAETECAYNGGTIVNSKIPQTGDGTPIALWMTTLLMAAFGLMGLKATSRKREN